jgi:guanylate kinase
LTTRPKRSRERHKIDYFFISLRQFHRYLRAGKILEWTKYLGYYYATPREFVQRQLKKSKHVLLCLDFRGARQIRRAYPKNTVLIFVAAPSLKALEERITKRCAKTKQEEICKRIQLARKEVLASRRYDYRLTNRNLQEAEKKLRDIISKEIASQN